MSDDDWDIAMADDAAPPEPDDALLARGVVGRGRQRRIRRRAIYGAVAASIAVVLIGGGVAVAQRHDASPDIAVNPTTTIPTGSATVREADADGIHFTLTLLTPVVRPGEFVRMTLHEENRADYAVHRDVCAFSIVVLAADTTEHGTSNQVCPDPAALIAPGASFDASAATPAPDVPGLHGVVVEPVYNESFPASLYQEPFPLKVVDAGSTSPITPLTTAGTGPNATEPLVGPAPTSAVAPPVQGTRAPRVGDFSGTLTLDRTTTALPYGVNVDLHVQNISDHDVDPNTVAIVCARDLTSDGHTTQTLRSNENLFFLVSPILRPGEQSGRSGTFDPTADDIGTVRCAAVIVVSDHQFQDGTITSIGRLTNIPAVSFTVTLAESTTTTAAAESTTTTTLPGP